MNTIDRLYQENPDPTAFARGYLDYLQTLLAAMDAGELARFIGILLKARREQARVFFIGNGGSAATASHFANDLAIGTRAFSPPFQALSLCDNTAIMTAIGNDFGYEELFTRQLAPFLKENDVVVAISASGNSPNVVQALEFAKERKATTVSLTGFDGGRLKTLADCSVHIPTPKGEYGPVEDLHLVVDHLVAAFLGQLVRQEKAAAGSSNP